MKKINCRIFNLFLPIIFVFLFNANHTQALVVNGADCPMSVHVLDVGKGDCILINCNDKYVLIDAGAHAVKDKVVSSLRNLGVSHLDEVIITHNHSDHFGGIAEVFQSFPVQKVILPEQRFSIPVTRLNTLKIPVEYGGSNHSLGELHFTKLTPVSGLMSHFSNNPTNDDDINDTSQIWKVTFKNKSFLFLGDAALFEIPALLSEFGHGNQLKADVLKVAHHGDSRCTTPQLLQAVQPAYAVMSTDQHFMNMRNNETVITNILQTYKNDIQIHRTDTDGNITYATDGNTLVVKHEKDTQGQNNLLLHTIPFYHQTPLQKRTQANGSNDNG
ncbi:MAG: MBL fold metallo-hydrolase, partial [Lactobacillales bacterium]|nr:MBL fold metallo-hydrolase [Lactobacillales bacterium]